jgi:hypothetical protein
MIKVWKYVVSFISLILIGGTLLDVLNYPKEVGLQHLAVLVVVLALNATFKTIMTPIFGSAELMTGLSPLEYEPATQGFNTQTVVTNNTTTTTNTYTKDE